MRPLLPLYTKVLALATIGVCLWADTSSAEKMNMYTAKQLCNTARGTFIREHNGKYSCTFPSETDMGLRTTTTFLNCSARGECEYVTFCGGRICHRHSGSADKKPPKPKPTKLEGPTTVTAGTAADRGFGRAGGSAAGSNAPAFGGFAAPSNSTPSASGGPALNTPAVAGRVGVAKPDGIPPQLAERLRRLQSPQR